MNARLQPDAFYANSVPLIQSWWQALDTAQAKALNGDGGGSYAPVAAIVVNGAGLGAGGLWTLAGGATLTTPLGSGARIRHGDSDYIQLAAGHASATRAIVTPCGRFADASDIDAAFALMNPFCATAVSYSGINQPPANTTGRAPYRVQVPLSVHTGATLSQVVFWFMVTTSHSGVPGTLPQFRVYKVDRFGVVTPLRSNSSLPGGFEPFPTPASGAAWYASGAGQSFTYTCDAGVVIDDANYEYIAEVVDESGTNALTGNSYITVVPTFTSIPDLRPQ